MGKSGYTCIRHVFCWLNLIIWLSGGVLLGGGIWLRIQHAGRTSMLPHLPWAGADSLLITVGAICFLAAFLGCCGAWMQSRCLLVTYFSLVVVLFCGEFIGASLGFVFRDTIGAQVKLELQKGIEGHYNHTDNNMTPIWDHLQTELKCCGVQDYKDWYQITAWPLERRVPDSCCIDVRQGCGTRKGVSDWHQDGCAPKLSLWLTERLHYSAILVFLVAFIQLFGLISSMVLFCTVRNHRGSRTYQSYKPAS